MSPRCCYSAVHNRNGERRGTFMIQQSDQAATAVAAASVTIGGVATGLDFGTLLAGFAGGLASLSFLPPMGLWRRIWTPVTATLTAGYTAPLAIHYLSGAAGDSVDPLTFQVGAAFVIGVLAQVAIPAAMRIARQRLSRFEQSGD